MVAVIVVMVVVSVFMVAGVLMASAGVLMGITATLKAGTDVLIVAHSDDGGWLAGGGGDGTGS